MVACCTSDSALGGPFLAKSRYHIACGRRKTACSPVWDLFVRLQKPLLNDDYAARRSICAFSVVEGMWAVRADRVVLRRFDECDSQRRLFNPTEPLLLRGGVCRPPGRTSESRCSSNTAQTPKPLCTVRHLPPFYSAQWPALKLRTQAQPSPFLSETIPTTSFTHS